MTILIKKIVKLVKLLAYNICRLFNKEASTSVKGVLLSFPSKELSLCVRVCVLINCLGVEHTCTVYVTGSSDGHRSSEAVL